MDIEFDFLFAIFKGVAVLLLTYGLILYPAIKPFIAWERLEPFLASPFHETVLLTLLFGQCMEYIALYITPNVGAISSLIVMLIYSLFLLAFQSAKKSTEHNLLESEDSSEDESSQIEIDTDGSSSEAESSSKEEGKPEIDDLQTTNNACSKSEESENDDPEIETTLPSETTASAAPQTNQVQGENEQDVFTLLAASTVVAETTVE